MTLQVVFGLPQERNKIMHYSKLSFRFFWLDFFEIAYFRTFVNARAFFKLPYVTFFCRVEIEV